MERKDVFRQAFVQHVHTLVQLGFERLDAPSLSTSEEPAITGHLVAAMRAVCEAPDAEAWMTTLSVHDDPPISSEGREGKARRRVDIEVEHVGRGPRPRFRWEAKRLRARQDVSRYTGRDGLGCFISRSYGAHLGSAGMLGYVQNGHVDAWIEKLSLALEEKKTNLCIVLQDGAPWHPSSMHSAGYCSVHDVDDGLTVYHLLLDCRSS